MIRHTVLFKFRPGISWEDPRVERAEQITRALPIHIPEIKNWWVGRNIAKRENAYDLVLQGDFADQEALARYLTHPEHQRGVAAWRELATWVVVDAEIDPESFQVRGVESTA